MPAVRDERRSGHGQKKVETRASVQKWVVAHGTAVTVGGSTVYDLAPSAG